jgi:hypothetical protein
MGWASQACLAARLSPRNGWSSAAFRLACTCRRKECEQEDDGGMYGCVEVDEKEGMNGEGPCGAGCSRARG